MQGLSSPPPSHVFKCCAAEKSASNLSKPTTDSALIFTIGLAKMGLHDTLFPRHCVIVEEQIPNHERDHESDTPIENYPSKQEDQFSKIHRVARIGIHSALQQIALVQFPFDSLRRLSRVHSHAPK